ncbi:MAG: hypothetical protein F6K45_08280, partial [Kamptonema sp. SIO1D9]|nr:hypothetical protein [Kamptonema sp. SIO1D9]
VMLNYLLNLAQEKNLPLRAEFVANNRNRMMYITYKFAGFKEIDKQDNLVILENNFQQIQPFPDYLKIDITD